MTKKCVVGFKRGGIHGHIFGYVLDRLVPCCKEFKRWFENTGSRKLISFNYAAEPGENGLNLVSRNGTQKLVILVNLAFNVIESEVKFCPFCSAKVEVKCTKYVSLEIRTREIFDGYNEEIQWEAGLDEDSDMKTRQ